MKKYFPSLDVSSLDWARDPFVLNMCVVEKDELTDISNDGGLKLKNLSTS